MSDYLKKPRIPSAHKAWSKFKLHCTKDSKIVQDASCLPQTRNLPHYSVALSDPPTPADYDPRLSESLESINMIENIGLDANCDALGSVATPLIAPPEPSAQSQILPKQVQTPNDTRLIRPTKNKGQGKQKVNTNAADQQPSEASSSDQHKAPQEDISTSNQLEISDEALNTDKPITPVHYPSTTSQKLTCILHDKFSLKDTNTSDGGSDFAKGVVEFNEDDGPPQPSRRQQHRPHTPTPPTMHPLLSSAPLGATHNLDNSSTHDAIHSG
ncbi:hypothetical protein DFH28DRAFT_926382 [Melampsora americana]|nr:hypothetical protein DFH28DRAFT_926382 [Melampsora americana]